MLPLVQDGLIVVWATVSARRIDTADACRRRKTRKVFPHSRQYPVYGTVLLPITRVCATKYSFWQGYSSIVTPLVLTRRQRFGCSVFGTRPPHSSDAYIQLPGDFAPWNPF